MKKQFTWLDLLVVGVAALAMHDGYLIAALLIATAGGLLSVWLEERTA